MNLGILRLWCVVAALIGLAGCAPSDEQPEPNTHLPGFDVWMPEGRVVKQGSHPAIGTYEVRDTTSVPKFLRGLFPQQAPSTKVSWRAETKTYSEPADIAALLDGALRGISVKGKGHVVAAGEGRWTSTYDFGKGKLVVAYARCEPWLTIMFMVGLEGEVRDESSAQRIVRSVKCRIDAQKPPSLQVSLRIPDHFGRAKNTDEPTYYSTSGGGLVTNFTNGNIARDYRLLQKVMGGMFAAALGSSTPLEVTVDPIKRPDGAVSTLSMLSGDLGELGKDALKIGTLYCADLDLTAMVLVFADDDPRTNATELTQSLECPSASGEELKHPSIDEVFSPACEAGDVKACRHLLELIRAGSASGNVMSFERAKARGCELGARILCDSQPQRNRR